MVIDLVSIISYVYVSNVLFDKINLENVLRIFLEWYFPTYRHGYYY